MSRHTCTCPRARRQLVGVLDADLNGPTITTPVGDSPCTPTHIDEGVERQSASTG